MMMSMPLFVIPVSRPIRFMMLTVPTIMIIISFFVMAIIMAAEFMMCPVTVMSKRYAEAYKQ
jgi:hypothetical protein